VHLVGSHYAVLCKSSPLLIPSYYQIHQTEFFLVSFVTTFSIWFSDVE